jgi:tRNA pseudouridine55 synthase
LYLILSIDLESYDMEGFLLINKPADITSFGCVGRIKRLLVKGTKIGHAGTLDKFATGLLIIGIGRGATRCLGTLLKLPKTYIGTGKLGELTDTYDPNGTVVKTCDMQVDDQQIKNALASFGSGYMQIPPVYSALKYKGQRLSDLSKAELGSLVDVAEIAKTKQRHIDLYALLLNDFSFPRFTIQANVSSGTYIRVLINDIAVRVNSCATTVELNRTVIGPFKNEKALEVADLTLDIIEQNLIPVTDVQYIVDSFCENN